MRIACVVSVAMSWSRSSEMLFGFRIGGWFRTSRGSSTAGERVTPIIRYLRRVPVRRPHIAPARPLRVRRPTDRRLRASPARGVQGPPRSNVHGVVKPLKGSESERRACASQGYRYRQLLYY
jgi:hypothetical protein